MRSPLKVSYSIPTREERFNGIPSAPKSKISKGDFDKAPLEIQGGKVTYAGKPLKTEAGVITCEAEDGAKVR